MLEIPRSKSTTVTKLETYLNAEVAQPNFQMHCFGSSNKKETQNKRKLLFMETINQTLTKPFIKSIWVKNDFICEYVDPNEKGKAGRNIFIIKKVKWSIRSFSFWKIFYVSLKKKKKTKAFYYLTSYIAWLNLEAVVLN